jgi:hypothetical protein
MDIPTPSISSSRDIAEDHGMEIRERETERDPFSL